MKKIKKLILVMLIIFINCNIKINAYSNETSNIVDYSTSDLVDEIIEKELDYITLYSTKYIGINQFIANNMHYKELVCREDAIDTVNDKIDLYFNDENLIENLNLLLNILNNNIDIYINNLPNARIETNTGIFTPNGSEVTNGLISSNVLNSGQIQYYKEKMFNDFPTLTEEDYIYPANSAYNCHSYAFYSQNPYTNNLKINYPNIYFEDDSYVSVLDPRPDDILCYWAYGNHDTYFIPQTGPYISHSAIIVSIEDGFDINDSTTLSKINLISKWGNMGVYTHDGDECEYGNINSSFQRVEVYRPRTNVSYNIYNSNNTINETATFSSNASSENKYEMYELTPNYTKNYEFKVSSNSNLDVRLYDVHMQLIPYTDTNSNQYIKQFTNKLKEDEIYYLRVAYTSSSIGGTINTQIISKQIESVDYGNNVMVANEYSYYNSDDSGLFKISIVNNNGNSFSCPNGAIGIYSEFDRFNPLKRLSTSLYELEAVNGVNCNNMIVHLNFGETYYIEVVLPITNYSDYNLKIKRIYQIEYIDLLYGEQESYNIITNETGVGDNFKKIEIMDDSSVWIEYDYVGTQNETIYFVLYKEIYNSTTNTYSLQLVFPEMMVTYGESLIWTSSITEGRYYIGYYNKTNSASTISITIG